MKTPGLCFAGRRPALPSVLVAASLHFAKSQLERLAIQLSDGDDRILKFDDIKGMSFAASAGRCRGPCLYNKGSSAVVQLISLCRVAEMTHMKVTGKKYIGATFRNSRHQLLGAADNVPFFVALREIKRMMCDDHLKRIVRKLA